MPFAPDEILFAATADCNLRCGHCITPKSKTTLSVKDAISFLRDCGRFGIRRIGFTGGEPFLASDFLDCVVRDVVKRRLLFDRIMTNAAWFRNEDELIKRLGRLKDAGYDGSFCISVDRFHKQDLKKVSLFIRRAASAWGRHDLISIACVTGSGDDITKAMIRRLAKLLGARLIGFESLRPAIVKKNVLLINIFKIPLAPIGKARRYSDPWGQKWFKEDYCRGPGNVFYVMADGDVKPCCGYATDSKELTIGNIRRDSMDEIMRKAARNSYVQAVFNSGLSRIRKRLEAGGIIFPGKAFDNCFFCHYILKKIPRPILNKCLALTAAFFLLGHIFAYAGGEAGKGAVMEIKVTSSAFKDGDMIPRKYTCDGDDVSPPIEWSGIPNGAKSIALISDDPDAPVGTWVHWVIFNIPPSENGLGEAISAQKTLANGSRQGANDSRQIGYGGPCPPSGTHRYYFKVYALDKMLELASGASKKDLLRAMEAHILGQGELMGRYKR